MKQRYRPKSYSLKLHLFFTIANILLFTTVVLGQLPQGRVLVGYYHNWNTASAPHIPLNQAHTAYNLIHVAFATPVPGTLYKMEFNPVVVGTTTFRNQIQSLQTAGKRVFISLGGGLHPVRMVNQAQKDTFVNTMSSILDAFGFDGIDIDFEGSSLFAAGTNLNTASDSGAHYLIAGIRQLMNRHRQVHQRKLGLSMAPETALVQGGMAAFGGIWGAYLPVIHALRDSIDLLHVQLYNSGSMPALNGSNYAVGTADFIVAMTEALIRGFQTSAGFFGGLRPQQIAVGLPACGMAAGSGYTDTITVGAAMRYLLGRGPRPGTYTLIQQGGYPQLGGMMTWSIPWDASVSCAVPYEFAHQFQRIFPVATPVSGRLLYANAGQTPMNNVVLRLKLNNQVLGLDTTDFMGNFDFGIQVPGLYNLEYATTKAWGGVNATDALGIGRHFANVELLPSFNAKAADVNLSGLVNATDALLSNRRFANLTVGLPSGDWIWENNTLQTTAGGYSQNLVWRCLSAGDVNGSYIPPSN